MTSNPQSLHIKSGQSPSWPSGQGGCTNSRLPWQCAQTSTRGITIVDIDTTSTWHGATRVRQFRGCDTPCRRRLGHIGRLDTAEPLAVGAHHIVRGPFRDAPDGVLSERRA
jgi:hypothetical protein